MSISSWIYGVNANPWTYTNTLKYLRLGSCAYSKYLNILHQSPQLRTLVIDSFRWIDEDVTLLSSSFSFPLESLILNESFHRKSFTSEHVNLFVSHLSSLRYLKFNSTREQFDSLFDGSFWEELISSKLPQLKYLNLNISMKCQNNNDYKSLQSIIEPFRTPFWLVDKRWFVTCAYGLSTNLIKLSTIHQNIYTYGEDLCEISSIDNRCRFTQGTSDQRQQYDKDKVIENNSLETKIRDCHQSWQRKKRFLSTNNSSFLHRASSNSGPITKFDT